MSREASYIIEVSDQLDDTVITYLDIFNTVNLGCGTEGLRGGIMMHWPENDRIRILKQLCERYPNTTFKLFRSGRDFAEYSMLWARNGAVYRYSPTVIWDLRNAVNVTNLEEMERSANVV